MLNFLVKTLAPRCHFVMSAGSAEEGSEWLRSHHFDLIILDISLPGQSGVSWLKELREQGFAGEVVLITAFADLDTAIESLRAGASDFILKPFRVPQILNAVKQCHERARLRKENYVLRRADASGRRHRAGLVGETPVMKALRAAIERVASVDSTILLQGESGTGKELVAREIHALSSRSAGPFVPINCAAVSPESLEIELFGHARGAFAGATRAREGLFHYAQGGTLFLDEIAELAAPVQAALLRAIEELAIRPLGSSQTVPLNLRIIAASNRNLKEEVAAARFRKDLYFRLQVVELTLPPLREHKEDIPALVRHFMERLAPTLRVEPLSISEQELSYLAQYSWPGNVRELRNLLERSLILGALNVSALYPGNSAYGTALKSRDSLDLATLEKHHILSVLESVQGDKSRAAEILGVSRRTLERRVTEWAATDAAHPERR